jgi:NADH-quinone oxidoreductase subunit G
VITAIPDRVVWLPTNSAGSAVRVTLAADAGAVVQITAGSAVAEPETAQTAETAATTKGA